jgi:carbon monoxide dehydrogenase subunit G
VKIKEDFTVGSPAAAVWDLIESGSALECVPGLTVHDAQAGSLEIPLGSDRLLLDGEAAVHLDPAGRSARVEARGVERTGRGRLRVLLSLEVEDHGLFSGIRTEADLVLAGELSHLSGRFGEAAHEIADGFAERMEALLGAPAVPREPAPGSGAPVPADEEPATRRAGWLARLLGRLRRG